MPAIEADGRKWWVLVAMGAILGVILLDETVVGVALPTVQRDLGMSEVSGDWRSVFLGRSAPFSWRLDRWSAAF
jgi:hypothetical protein